MWPQYDRVLRALYYMNQHFGALETVNSIMTSVLGQAKGKKAGKRR